MCACQTSVIYGKANLHPAIQNAIIQVKSGSGAGLTAQILRTEAATGLPVIGYGPNLGGSVVKGIQAAGGLVTKDNSF